MRSIEGFILSGGASSRMGTAKAKLILGDKSLEMRAARTVQAVASAVFIVGSGPVQDFEVLRDVVAPHFGNRRAAILGLYTALVNCRASHAAVLACDLPFVTPQLIEKLAGTSTDSEDADAVIPVQSDGRLQPLCAIYRPRQCLPIIETALSGDDWRLRETVGSLNIRRVEFSEIADLPGSENFFFNLNTPEDYNRAAKLAEQELDASTGK